MLSLFFFVFCASFQSVSEFRWFVFVCSCVQLTSFRISVVHVFNLFQNSCRFVCLLSWFQPVSELLSFFVCGGIVQSLYVDSRHLHAVPSVEPWFSACIHGFVLHLAQHMPHLSLMSIGALSGTSMREGSAGPDASAIVALLIPPVALGA